MLMENRSETPAHPDRLQAFVFRIGLEDVVGDTGPHHWRGHITHVDSGAARYVDNYGDLFYFVNHYLLNHGPSLRL